MTEALLWQTLEDCFRRSDLTGIAALADEVALTDEALAATLRWIGRQWQNLNPKEAYGSPKWQAWCPTDAWSGWLWQGFSCFRSLIEDLHTSRLHFLEEYQ